ncbi:MAG: DNA mismatch repair endonuclease MutL [Deltaproteobacteria bacterium]|nr:DNA mismatch repair endonuclease MutL [Deltaproteobacteria bacterium]
MPLIHLLPPGLVNQIAAGEVVERPASVLKELVENAVDAGARTVAVDTEEGGLALVRVVDDGSGMSPDDAELCLERHATSKLRDAAGLAAIATMGFRGEALPAIASVSRMRIDTCAGEGGAGTRIAVEGGQVVERGPVGRARGTTIEVRDLFFNTPARRKFMRAPATESGHATEALVRLALAHAAVGFTLRSAGRVVLASAPGAPLAERLAAAIGREAARKLVEIAGERGGVRVRALLTSPDHSEATSRGLYLFVNGRYVRDRSATHAALRAYAETLPHGRWPAGAIFVELPLDRVDVNVHPQKLEVRFADPRGVQDAIHRAVADGLRTAPWLRHAAPAPAGQLPPASMAGEEVANLLAEARAAGGPAFAPAPAGASAAFAFPLPAPAPEAPPPPAAGYFASLRYVGQHARTYLLCEAPGGSLVVIDQHASHERVLFHRLREAWRGRRIAVQPLLVPQVVHLPPAAARALEGGLDELARLGIEAEAFGGDAFAVKGLPAVLAGVDAAALLTDLAQQLDQVEHGRAAEQAWHDLLATMACHSAVRANQDLASDEVRALLDQLDAIDFKANCPHGRPVVFELALADLERRVGRR